MDDATQKLVDKARHLRTRLMGSDEGADVIEVADALGDLADALEAAQRPPFNPLHESVCRCGATGNGECVRPPVSPEAVSALKKEVWTEYRDRVLIPLDPDRDEWPSRYEVFYAALDALLARFSIPSQPVYDEEKIARWLRGIFDPLAGMIPWDVDSTAGRDYLVKAAALVAALRGGELTREETNE